MTKNRSEMEKLELPSIEPVRQERSSILVGVLPGLLLIALHLLPFTGLETQLDVQVAGMSVLTLSKLLLAICLAVMFRVYWQRGFKAAASEAADHAQSATSETVRMLHEARYQRERRSKELDEALQRLKESDNRIKSLSADARRAIALTRTTIDASSDAMIITDVHGVIQDISGPTCTMCNVHRLDALGKPFDELIHLFDPNAESPEQHPIRRLALGAIEATDNVPKLEHCLLTTRLGKTRPVLVTSMAISDEEGTVAGAYVKFETEDAAANAEGETTTLTQSRIPSNLDPITTLQTREAFNRRADELLRNARQQGSQHSLLFMAPNNLDFTADRHGYRAAEQLLWQLGQSCKDTVPSGGYSFYVATGRFAMLLPETSVDDARTVGENIRESLNGKTLTWDDQAINLQSSITALPIDANSPGVATLLDQAEKMLRSARRSGSQGVFTGMPTTPQKDGRFDDHGWTVWMKQRLEAGLGHLMSQEVLPVDKENGKKLIECYVRIEDTDGVWIAPSEYLPALQRTGDTGIIDIWVLSQLIKQMQDNPKLSETFKLLSINVSPESICSNEFVSRALERLTDYPIEAQQICFEIQESTATSLHKETDNFIRTMQKAGAKVAIDQCRGINLQYILRHWKPDLVKIDHSLIRRCDKDKLSQVQIRWLVESARLSKVDVVACGVEKESWFPILQKIGVNYMQGSALNKIGPIMF